MENEKIPVFDRVMNELKNPHEKSDFLNITEENRKTLIKFATHLKAKGLSDGRIEKLIFFMKTVTKVLDKDYQKANREDIERVLSTLRSGRVKTQRTDKRKAEGRKYTANTLKDFMVVIKMFWQWLYGYPRKKYPEIVDWFTSNVKRNEENRIQILTPEQVKMIIEKLPDIKSKCFVALEYETAARPHELIGLRWQDVKDNSSGVGKSILVVGKTGMRRLFSIWSAKFLVRYMNSHPNADKNDPDVPLWIGFRNFKSMNLNQYGLITYQAFSKKFKKAALEAGIKFRVSLYTLRHSRLTELLKQKGMSEALVKLMAGHTPGSSTIRVYSHLTSDDLETAIMEMHNIKRKKVVKAEDIELPGKCPVCNSDVSSEELFCERCLTPLHKEQAQEKQRYDLMKNQIFSDEKNVIKLITDPRFQKIIEKLKNE